MEQRIRTPLPTPLTGSAPARSPGSRDQHSRQAARLAMYCRLAAGDGLAVVIGFSLARLVRTDDWMTPHGVNLMVVIAVLYAAMGVITRAFALEVLDDYVESARRALIALVQAFMILFALLFAFQLGQEISRVALFMALGATLIPMLAFRYAAYV